MGVALLVVAKQGGRDGPVYPVSWSRNDPVFLKQIRSRIKVNTGNIRLLWMLLDKDYS